MSGFFRENLSRRVSADRIIITEVLGSPESLRLFAEHSVECYSYDPRPAGF